MRLQPNSGDLDGVNWTARDGNSLSVLAQFLHGSLGAGNGLHVFHEVASHEKPEPPFGFVVLILENQAEVEVEDVLGAGQWKAVGVVPADEGGRAVAQDIIDVEGDQTVRDLRDRALLGVFVYTFARVSAVVTMKVRDYRVGGRRADTHLREKGGVVNRVPVHHKLREYLDEYLEAAKLAKAPESWLWRSMPGRKDELLEKPMSRHDALQVVKRRSATANLPADI